MRRRTILAADLDVARRWPATDFYRRGILASGIDHGFPGRPSALLGRTGRHSAPACHSWAAGALFFAGLAPEAPASRLDSDEGATSIFLGLWRSLPAQIA